MMNTVSFINRVQRYDSFFTPTILFYMDFLLLGNSDFENVGGKRYITIKKRVTFLYCSQLFGTLAPPKILRLGNKKK